MRQCRQCRHFNLNTLQSALDIGRPRELREPSAFEDGQLLAKNNFRTKHGNFQRHVSSPFPVNKHDQHWNHKPYQMEVVLRKGLLERRLACKVQEDSALIDFF